MESLNVDIRVILYMGTLKLGGLKPALRTWITNKEKELNEKSWHVSQHRKADLKKVALCQGAVKKFVWASEDPEYVHIIQMISPTKQSNGQCKVCRIPIDSWRETKIKVFYETIKEKNQKVVYGQRPSLMSYKCWRELTRKAKKKGLI